MGKRKDQIIPKAIAKVINNSDEMKQAIIEAYFEIQQINMNNKQQEKQKWKEKMFGSEKPLPKNKILHKIVNIRSGLKAFFKILFIKQEDVLEGLGTVSLLKLILLPIFDILRYGLYIFVVYALYSIFAFKSFWGIVLAVFAFLLARIFRIVSLEIDNMKDREYLISLFSCVMSFGAIIIAIIALLNI